MIAQRKKEKGKQQTPLNNVQYPEGIDFFCNSLQVKVPLISLSFLKVKYFIFLSLIQ